MIAEHLEPKGLKRDTPAEHSDYRLTSRKAAEWGSMRLLEVLERTGLRP